ncbi:hypothetical protein GCM10028824_13180 [Hymenobacter segetis]|uniref:Uncharacterized protein n=1 Tax=Hymenobacter segetis TaxID=2025509 RepID=A0ABU9M1Q7_9BACT
MPTATSIKPNPDTTATPLAGGATPPEQPNTAATPWPADVPRPVPDDAPLDDTLTEAAGMARNDDALGPYAGSF